MRYSSHYPFYNACPLKSLEFSVSSADLESATVAASLDVKVMKITVDSNGKIVANGTFGFVKLSQEIGVGIREIGIQLGGLELTASELKADGTFKWSVKGETINILGTQVPYEYSNTANIPSILRMNRGLDLVGEYAEGSRVAQRVRNGAEWKN